MPEWIAGSLRSGWKSALLVLKLVVPFYILADLLLYYELLRPFTGLFAPITSLLGLPAESAMALAAGMLINLYAGIAFAAPLGLGPQEWTVLGVFLGVAHSLPVENGIMKKLGVSLSYSFALRLGMAFVTVGPVLLLPESWFGAIVDHKVAEQAIHAGFLALLRHSLQNAALLAGKIILLLTVVIFLMDFLKSRRFMQAYATRLPVVFAFLAGQLLGITYGAGIILKEAGDGNLNRRTILCIASFLMICHSLLEDPLLFVLFGANYWIIMGTRSVMAGLVCLAVYRFTAPRHPRSG